MLDAAPTGSVRITVNDADANAVNDGIDQDRTNGNSTSPTRFRLLASDRATQVGTAQFVDTDAANNATVTFDVDTVGAYFLETTVGAALIYESDDPRFNTSANLNNDDNAYSITVSEDGGLIGQFQAGFRQNVTATRSLFFLVSPGTENLFLRNFDADSGPSSIEYIRPDGTVTQGTVSGGGIWNGPAGTRNDGGDVIGGLTDADAGVWEVRINDLNNFNQLIFEPNVGTSRADAQRLIYFEERPSTAGAFTLSDGGTREAPTNAPVDHTFTIRNDFPAPDAFEFELSGTAPGFTAELFRAGDNAGDPPVALTDTTGDGRIDTGTLDALETVDLILRVTPTAGTTATDTTTVTVQSLLQGRLTNTPPETQSADFTTRRLNAGPSVDLPPAQPTPTDTPVVFAQANGYAITVADDDAGSGTLDVTVSVSGGTFTLGGFNGITFSQGDGTDDAVTTFRGTVADLNLALDGATFTPDAGYVGDADLRVEVEDRGNTGLADVTRSLILGEAGASPGSGDGFTVVSDPAANGGQAIELGGTASATDPDAASQTEFTFTTEQAGLHRVFLLARAATAGADAVFLQIDSADPDLSQNITRSDGWVRLDDLFAATPTPGFSHLRSANADGPNATAPRHRLPHRLLPGRGHAHPPSRDRRARPADRRNPGHQQRRRARRHRHRVARRPLFRGGRHRGGRRHQ